MQSKYIVTILFAFILLSANAQPCTPNPLYTDSLPGLYPDTLPDAIQGTGYVATIDVVNDTTITIPGYYFVKGERLCHVDTLFGGSMIAEAYNGNIGGFDVAANSGSVPNFSPAQWC